MSFYNHFGQPSHFPGHQPGSYPYSSSAVTATPSISSPEQTKIAAQGFMLKQVHTSEHLTTYVWPSDVHTYLHHQRPLRGRSTYLLTVRLRIRYLKSLGAAASTYLLAKFSAASRPKYILTYVRVRCSASTCCLNMKPCAE